MGQGLLDTTQGFQKVVTASTSLLWGVKPLPTPLPKHCFTELYGKDLFSLTMCSFILTVGFAALMGWSLSLPQHHPCSQHCLQISSNSDPTSHAGTEGQPLLFFCNYYLELISPTLITTPHVYPPPPLLFPEIIFFLLTQLWPVVSCISSRNLYLRF